MILKNLWRRKTRTLLTAFGIAVGVAAVIVLSAFGEGMARGFGQASASPEADLIVSQDDAIMIILGALDEELGDQIAEIRGVDEVAGTIIGIIQMPDTPYFLVNGENPRSFALNHYKVKTGQTLTGRRQVLLGKSTATNLKKQPGDSFRINDFSYRVVGIYETGSSFEDNGAVIHLEDAQRAFDKRRQVSIFKVKVRDPQQIEQVREQINQRWDDLLVTRSGEASKQDDMLAVYSSLGWFLGIFAILVGGLGMMNAMLMSVFERTREIGVLRALGWRRRRIVGMIVGEALLLALLGGIFGIGLGTLLLALSSTLPSVSGFLDDIYNPTMLVQAMLIALILGVVGGAYPAWRAAQLAPVEAMRAESGASVSFGMLSKLLARLLPGTALRNLWRRPTRTLMTTLGLGIGVGFIVALMGIIEGSRHLFSEILPAGQADLVAEQANVSDMTFSAIDERVTDQIRARPEVRAVSKIVFGTASMPGIPFFMVFGLDPNEDYIQHYRLREGRTIERPREILLGRLAARTLEKELGDTLHVGGASYEIVGIYENGIAFEDSSSVISLKEAQRLFRKPRQVSFITIALHDPARAAETARLFEQAFPEIIVSQAAQLTERMQDFATMNAIFGALVLLMVIVGGIVMLNVMMMSVFERTQEVGVLRALGWRRRRVLRMILVESLALGLLSGLMGIGIGMGLSRAFQYEPTYGSLLPAIYTPMTFVQVLLLVLLLGGLGGVLPAWRAANLRPIEALRYE